MDSPRDDEIMPVYLREHIQRKDYGNKWLQRFASFFFKNWGEVNAMNGNIFYL